jgi:hypothetical protein
MRKSQTRKIPFRHKLLMGLRKVNDMPMTIIDSLGHEIALNFAKHMILNRPYKNHEYQRELMRHAQQMAK